jgi:hypothetical protein
MGICFLDDLAPVQDVELERVVEVRPLVCFLWAHLIVHIHDEFFLVMHVHAPLVNHFDPLPILRQGICDLDDNVNLMPHTPNA